MLTHAKEKSKIRIVIKNIFERSKILIGKYFTYFNFISSTNFKKLFFEI